MKSKTFSFADFTVRVDKIRVIFKSEVEIDKHMFPSIEIIMDGTDAKFVAPYAKKTDRDTDYKTIIELMNKEDKE